LGLAEVPPNLGTMSALVGLLVSTALAAQPAEPAEEPRSETEQPAEEDPAEVPPPESEPVATEVAPSTPEPAPVETESAPIAVKAEDEEEGPPERKVITREKGDFGMTFVFGGLAPMSIAGINDYTVNRLLFSELGFRAVLDRIVIPFSVGAGFFSHRPSEGTDRGDVGVGATVAVLADFRRGKRIIPHAGGELHMHYVDPSGRSNYLFNFSIGPVIGIEYFFANHVSLLLQGKLNVGINVLDGLTQVDFGTIIAAGGQMGLSFYF
jgi:hypothetical protein